jgi:hypothetical protein
MCKERLFTKNITISNFRLVDGENLENPNKFEQGKPLTEEALIVAEVFYAPKGFRAEIHAESPLHVWDEEHAKRLFGISEENPNGDLREKNFETALAAMHFLTRRLKRLGWDPLDSWH